MKALFYIIVIFAFPLAGNGQSIEKDATNKYTCSAVVQIDSVKSGVLFSRAMEWISMNYKSAQDVIQYSDQATGKIICKGNFKVGLYMKEGWVEHTLVLEFKDGRFRYTYTDFVYFSAGSGRVSFDGNNMMGRKKAIETTEEKIAASVKSLTGYLKDGGGKGEW